MQFKSNRTKPIFQKQYLEATCEKETCRSEGCVPPPPPVPESPGKCCCLCFMRVNCANLRI